MPNQAGEADKLSTFKKRSKVQCPPIRINVDGNLLHDPMINHWNDSVHQELLHTRCISDPKPHFIEQECIIKPLKWQAIFSPVFNTEWHPENGGAFCIKDAASVCLNSSTWWDCFRLWPDVKHEQYWGSFLHKGCFLCLPKFFYLVRLLPFVTWCETWAILRLFTNMYSNGWKK